MEAIQMIRNPRQLTAKNHELMGEVLKLQAELTRLKASRLTVLEIENIIEHTSSFAPINVLAQSIHKAQSEKDGGE